MAMEFATRTWADLGHSPPYYKVITFRRFSTGQTRNYGWFVVCRSVSSPRFAKLCRNEFAGTERAFQARAVVPFTFMKENRPERPRSSIEALKDASHLYEVERRTYHAQRPGFRIAELQISPTQIVPWHYHNNVHDTFYVVEGTIRIFLQAPKEEVHLERGQTYSV